MYSSVRAENAGRDDPALGDHPGQAARRERSSTVAEEEDLVAGLVVLGDEPVALADVGVDTVAEGAAAQPVPQAGPDTSDVMLQLSPAAGSTRCLRHAAAELVNVGVVVSVVPSTVHEDREAHAQEYCRGDASRNIHLHVRPPQPPAGPQPKRRTI